MYVVLIVGIILLVYSLRYRWDAGRIQRYISERRGRLLEKKWRLFGPGWFGEKDSRIYEVKYEDAEGKLHHAFCKTGLWTGVYFTKDSVIGTARRTSVQHR